jgi:hypothetical protein
MKLQQGLVKQLALMSHIKDLVHIPQKLMQLQVLHVQANDPPPSLHHTQRKVIIYANDVD